MKMVAPPWGTFVHFAAWLLEINDAAETDPDGLIAALRLSPAAAVDVASRFRAAESAMVQARRAVQDAQLRADGVPEVALAHPALREELAEGLRATHRLARTPVHRLRSDADGNWRPHRATTDGLVLGAFLVTDGRTRDAAAQFLNRNAPHARGSLVTDENVRDSLQRFVQASVRRSVKPGIVVEATAVLHLHRLLTTRALWAQYHRARGANRIEVYAPQMLASGRMLADFTRAGETIEITPEVIHRGASILRKLEIAHLKNMLRTRSQIEAKTEGGTAPGLA